MNATRSPPQLSVVIMSFDMQRELPRTIRSLSPPLQRGVAADDYELIVVDNNSPAPPEESALRAIADNLSLHFAPDPSVSPVRAVNYGIARARGDLVGVCIDGARMASPGLLAAALAASRLHQKPVLGSLAFHLGPKVQNESILEGYDQATEDKLLAHARWEEDAYRLFDISVPAGSSKEGWFVLPVESNALFMRRAHWEELGGYDARFECAGGGLVNLDMWRRACDDPSGELIMLLGEATFHQIHGGVATNNPAPPWAVFHEEYVRIRGERFRKSARAPAYYGRLHPRAAKSLQYSAARFAAAHPAGD
jgi:glycosyltransferase involved in cell wall biosynthesis